MPIKTDIQCPRPSHLVYRKLRFEPIGAAAHRVASGNSIRDGDKLLMTAITVLFVLSMSELTLGYIGGGARSKIGTANHRHRRLLRACRERPPSSVMKSRLFNGFISICCPSQGLRGIIPD
jgi:hypothetical protein